MVGIGTITAANPGGPSTNTKARSTEIVLELLSQLEQKPGESRVFGSSTINLSCPGEFR